MPQNPQNDWPKKDGPWPIELVRSCWGFNSRLARVMLVMCIIPRPRTLPIAGLRGRKSGAEMMADHGIFRYMGWTGYNMKSYSWQNDNPCLLENQKVPWPWHRTSTQKPWAKKMPVGQPESLFVFLRFWDPKIFRVTLMQIQRWLLRYSHLCWLYVICSELHDHQAKLHSFLQQLLSAVGEYVFDISEVQAQAPYIFLDPHKILKISGEIPPSAPESVSFLTFFRGSMVSTNGFMI